MAAAVAVLEVPSDVADELLVFYFENRRRSGGGPVQSWRRRGGRAILTFERPEDAQRVLSRTDHALQGVHLTVQPAAPRDYGKVVLQGLNPQSSLELVELYVEHILDCERNAYSIHRSPAGDQALVELQAAISHPEFLALADRVQSRMLDGASLVLDWVEQTDSILVQSHHGSQLQPEVLTLYFESRRSGGGRVQSVRLLPGGMLAVVSFQDRTVVDRVLKQPHQLPDGDLKVSPHYDFLEAPEAAAELQVGGAGMALSTTLPVAEATTRRLLQSKGILQELGASAPECVLRCDEAGLHILGGDPILRQQLQECIQAALHAVTQERLPSSTLVLEFLQRTDVQEHLAEQLAEHGVGACYIPTAEEVLIIALKPSVAQLAASLLGSFLSSISLPLSERQLLALASPRWAQVQAGLRCCCVCLAEDGEHLEGLTLPGLEEENVAELKRGLQDCLPDEMLVTMEPGRLHYLQLHRHELLAGLADVTLLPLEGAEVTGLRLNGDSWACQAAAELLQSLLCAIRVRTVVLHLPGVSRFLLEERGQAILQGLERSFSCAFGLEHLQWHPPESQHNLETSQEPIALMCRRDSLRGLKQQPKNPVGVAEGQSEANLEEIKGLLAALQPPRVAFPAAEEEAAETAAEPLVEVPPAFERQTSLADLDAIEEGPLPVPGPIPSLALEEEEEEAQLLLAIQQSMDSARQEVEELARATELSLRSFEQEQPSSPDADIRSVMRASLEAAAATRLQIYTALEEDAEAVVQELEHALGMHLREEMVQNEALLSLPALCLDYLTYLERKHAVNITLAGPVATVSGFLDYPVAATRDLALLLARLLHVEVAEGCGDARWVRWEPSEQGLSTPYSAQASALLEQAWCRGHKRIEVFFDGRPFAVDFERMEEYDVGNGCTLPIGRTELQLPLASPALLDPPAEGEVKLLPLAEDSEEFQRTIQGFYDTLAGLHGKLWIVKLEKVMHPLLYQQYQLKKAAMQKACGHQAVERILYHGTTEQSSHEICQHGFNRSFCGKNATHYGHGVYFAVKACLSARDQYSPRSPDGNKYIFVTRTLVGDYTAGNASMRVPPLREGDATLRRYDSTVDNPRKPSIFVIFNDTQAYPEYLITCRWVDPKGRPPPVSPLPPW
ncbi:protein mono-ADP-ribosyltransferase PARP10 isoform X2 [Ahaetulla prasina]|uniref:protein mono-ADP-ribosyltransferase PARP10 isoform X2 n=1 Tax=Ahaetulla prasina TaxID=499056 RepID=UPI002647B4B3|nr:protein mono-ADP-ribosyltransferase PARP10 isoform X2 [Ahaetulla prasina]